MAGWLYKNFRLVSFIDSCVWGYGDNLIKELDYAYHLYYDNYGRYLYNYDDVLFSSSHVHMMMSTALAYMIDKTECLIFYNTTNSVRKFDRNSMTDSPWIYSEIAISKIVRKKFPIRKKKLSENLIGDNKLQIYRSLDSKHLVRLNYKILSMWKDSLQDYSVPPKGSETLDRLYEITSS